MIKSPTFRLLRVEYRLVQDLSMAGRKAIQYPQRQAGIAPSWSREVTIPGPDPNRPSEIRDSFYLCGVSQAEMVRGHHGRNPAPLMPKTESTSDIPGGPNLMCCYDRLPNFRWRPA